MHWQQVCVRSIIVACWVAISVYALLGIKNIGVRLWKVAKDIRFYWTSAVEGKPKGFCFFLYKLYCMRPREKAEGELSRHIEMLVSQAQVERTRSLAAKVPLPLGIMLFSVLRDPDVQNHWNHASLQTFYSLAFGWLGNSLVALLVCLTWTLRPSSCTQRRTQVSQVIFSVLNFFYSYTAEQIVPFTMGSQTLGVVRVLHGILSGNTLLTFVCNVALSCVNVWTLRRMIFPFGAPHWLHSTIVSIVIREVFTALTAVVICHVLASRTRQEVIAMVQAQVASQSEHNIRGLLASLCDAEVRVSDDLKITEPAAALGGLLLIPNGLQGRNLVDFIHNDDRERFTLFMVHSSTVTPQTCLAPAIHVSMVDQAGSTVNVQIYRSSSLDILGHAVHHLGICEHSAGERQIAREGFAFAGQLDDQVPHFMVPSDGLQALDTKSLSSSASDSVSLSGVSSSPELEVWIDAMSPQLTVFKCTSLLAVLLGRAGKRSRWSLAKAIVNNEGFISKLQSHVQEYMYNGASVGSDLALGSYIFQPLNAGSKRSMFQAHCFLDCRPLRVGSSQSPRQVSSSESESADNVTTMGDCVRIVLTGMTKVANSKMKVATGSFHTGTSSQATKTCLGVRCPMDCCRER
eukprot:CAMPEP_0178391774 /NCGR_PEP_ID=MMETSP0689_2-20121128/11337_1 /TAXON_ID=160604 /ORGANISM="Amphidinium massartii, Strain CS-259" /LENGTH=629 /DNA_ID=CAMNT_0020012329 /DNA_START=41 /DNA_END=1927 /DNA_ORIENTATION=+